MPIQRTIMVDDDGTGTTGTILNNAWLQAIYNQIDAADSPAVGPWTPTDQSGAGLALAVVVARFTITGKRVEFTVGVTYPANASGAGAIVSLPAQAAYTSGAYTTVGIARVGSIYAANSALFIYDLNGAAVPNSALAGQTLHMAGFYFIA